MLTVLLPVNMDRYNLKLEMYRNYIAYEYTGFFPSDYLTHD